MRVYLLYAVLLCVLCGCRSETLENLTLNVMSSSSEIEEGGYLIYNLEKTGSLSRELILKMTFSTASYTLDYANLEDYNPSLEYSLDDGVSWQYNTDKSSIKLLPSVSNCRIRISTIDDKTPEILVERLSIQISPVNTNDWHLFTKKPPVLNGLIRDNDVSQDLRSKIDAKNYLFVLESDESNNFVLKAVATKVHDKKQKAIIDSDYNDLIKLASAIKSTSPIFSKIKQLFAGYNSSSRTLGAVQPLTNSNEQPNLSQWAMYINLAYGYTDFETGKFQEFNANGEIASTFVHEMAHILTLDDTQRSLILDGQICSSTFVQEQQEASCFFATSYASSFLQKFYDVFNGVISAKQGLSRPDFINTYAKYNYAEDLAESFLGYTCHNREQNTLQGSYFDKIIFYDQYPNAREIRDKIKQIGYTLKNNDDTDFNSGFARMETVSFNCINRDIIP